MVAFDLLGNRIVRVGVSVREDRGRCVTTIKGGEMGLIAGYAMQPFIVAYWLVLTMKNLVDYIAGRNE